MAKLTDLHLKVQDFEARLSPEVRARSVCREGCARCCYTDISVFSLEAKFIIDWFAALPQQTRRELIERWESSEAPGACVFLREESCTIYEARPLICRTQGLPLSYKEDGEAYLDICPLNDQMLEVVKGTEILNLDLLNTILARLTDVHGERIPLKDLIEELKKLI